jgi:glucose/arabinose dehydrogenase
MKVRKAVFGALAAGLVAVTAGLPAAAQEPAMTEVASGLNSPRGLSFGPNGALYVAEAGTGGEGACVTGPEGDLVCLGESGSITRVWNGQQSRVVEGLPSAAGEDGSGAIGAQDVSLQGNQLFIAVGLGADPAVRDELALGSAFASLVRANPSGKWKAVSDLGAYETANNPDGDVVDSNVHSVAAGPGGQVVADAGGNSLVQVKANGQQSTLAVFPARTVPHPFIPGATVDMHAVPTSVVQGPDGAWYVGQLTGFPFPVGGANVYRVLPREAPTVFASGFTNVIDIAFDAAGNLYVLEIDQSSLLADPEFNGRLVRVNTDGNQETLVSEGLFAPGGVAIGPDGAAYVTTCTVCPGAGSVVRITV